MKQFNDINQAYKCIRKQSQLYTSDRIRSGYKTFIECLNLSAKGKLEPLPVTLAELQSRFMPDSMDEVIYEMATTWEGPHIVCSFYQALLDHDGASLLNDGFNLKARQTICQNAASPHLIELFAEVLNSLHQEDSAN